MVCLQADRGDKLDIMYEARHRDSQVIGTRRDANGATDLSLFHLSLCKQDREYMGLPRQSVAGSGLITSYLTQRRARWFLTPTSLESICLLNGFQFV